MSTSWVNSKTEICNLALGMVGDKRIQKYGDTDDLNARICRDFYDQVRDSLLRSANWGFALTRATLARFSDTPVFGRDYQYVLPADYIKILSLNDLNPSDATDCFTVEMAGDNKDVAVLVTDEDEANIRYVFRNDTPATYSALFVEAFASKLASHIAFPITGDPQLAATLHQKSVMDLQKAIHENVNEHKPVIKGIAADSGLVRARRSTAIG